MSREIHLDEILTCRKKEDLDLRIKEFKEITYPSKILEKVDNKKMTEEDVVENVKKLMDKVEKIEECLNKD